MKIDAKKLRLAMARACLDTVDLADKAGVHKGTVFNVLSGRTIGNLSTIGKIANALGVDVTEILED